MLGTFTGAEDAVVSKSNMIADFIESKIQQGVRQ